MKFHQSCSRLPAAALCLILSAAPLSAVGTAHAADPVAPVVSGWGDFVRGVACGAGIAVLGPLAGGITCIALLADVVE